MLTKRRFAFGMGALAAGGVLFPAINTRGAGAAERLPDDFARIERESGGRLGVAVVDTRLKAQWGHRADERFPMCSTFKLLAAAAVLARVDTGKEQLTRRIRFEASDVVVGSPVTKDRAGGTGMTVAELCEAAMTMSDNTAGNLLLGMVGGPIGFTDFVASLGDTMTRLDRIEPALNEAAPGDMRDTTSPSAMAANLRALILEDALSVDSRMRLINWLIANKTGDTRLRAGVPNGWRIGDKTGSGERGTTNDVAIIWPGRREPILVAAYLTGTTAAPEQRNATLAAVGRAIAAVMV
jgi:beta-lactamase class A